MFSNAGSRAVHVLQGFLGQVTRSYVRRITPLSVVPRGAKLKPKYGYEEEEPMDPEVLERIQAMDAEGLEPDAENFGNAYQAHEWEMEEIYKKIGRSRMIRKHFKSTNQPEICVLTYAEKEKIRFLHKSDPEEWNVETLAQAFPISEQGVFKLLKSSFRCKFPEDIQKHDEFLANKLKLIKEGKIKLTPELREKMEIRNAMPLNLGATSIPEIGALVPARKPKKLGEFARLVAKPGSEGFEEPEPDNTLYLRRGKVDKNQKPVRPPTLPPLENYDSRLIRDEQSLNLGTNEPMTLADFESKVKSIDATAEIDQEDEKQIHYLLNYNKRNPVPQQNQVDEELDTTKPRLTTNQHYEKFDEEVVKYKRDLEENQKEKVQVTVDKGRPYIYDREHGYQKLFSSEASDHIKLPANAKKEGSLYRVGDSYYDEDGEFLYRVI